jgi:hypothetical protein
LALFACFEPNIDLFWFYNGLNYEYFNTVDVLIRPENLFIFENRGAAFVIPLNIESEGL